MRLGSFVVLNVSPPIRATCMIDPLRRFRQQLKPSHEHR
jgi:hypothetical protein